MIHEDTVGDHFPKVLTLTLHPSSGKKEFSAPSEVRCVQSSVPSLLLSLQFVQTIALHLLLTFTLCLLQIPSWHFSTRHSVRMHTKERDGHNYELLEYNPEIHSYSFSKIYVQFPVFACFMMLTDLMDELNKNHIFSGSHFILQETFN